MTLPEELSDLEKNIILNYANFSDNSNLSPLEQQIKFLGEVFLTLLASEILPISKFSKVNWNFEDYKPEITLLEFFHQIVDNSDVISLNNKIILQMEQFLNSHEETRSLTLTPKVILSNLANFPFQLEEDLTSTHLCPQLLSIITEYYPLVSSEKKKSGKYYTLPNDAELISLLVIFRFLNVYCGYSHYDTVFNLIVKNKTDNSLENQVIDKIPSEVRILDPSCGSGTFAIQLTRLLGKLGKLKGKTISIFVDAVDLDPLPLLVTRLRFFLLELCCFLQYGSSTIQIEINIRNEDFLFGNNKKKFDIIIGNPPYIRHEDIGSEDIPNYKKKLIEKFMKETDKQNSFDKKSDLYIYFCLESLKMLKKTGVLGFLTSNAWLEVKYGKTLQNYLIQMLSNKQLAQCEIIYQAGSRFWKQIGINSVVFLATRSPNSRSQSPGMFFSESNSVLTQIPTPELKQSMLFSREAITPSYRTEFIPLSELSITNKWAGSFLRASKNERRILKKIIALGEPMQAIADVQFGIKTGANDFFHLIGIEDESQRYIEIRNKRNYYGRIENHFLVPLIKSPSELDNYLVNPKFSKNWLFYCHKPKDQLKGTGALEYIKWGEREIIPVKQGRKMGSNIQGYASLASIRERELWYSINPYPIPQLIWAKSYHDKPGCFVNQGKLYPDQRFYSIYPHNEGITPLLFIYLNSSFVWALMEQAGNTNMGLGVLDTNVYWLKTLSIPKLVSPKHIEIVKKLASELKATNKRESITSNSSIRMKIDDFFRDLLELTDSEFIIIVNFIKKSIKRRLTRY